MREWNRMKEGERQCVQARKTKLNFREIKSNLNNTMGETLNAQRNQQSNSNNNKYIAEAAVSATRATRTSSSISLLIYLYRNSFRPCPLPPAPPSTQPLPLRPQPFFSLLLSSIVYMLRASFDMPAELN